MTAKWAKPALLLVLMLVFPHAALAQTSIAGLVTDETGAVLPGVTVEAASPALIEGARTAFTDGQGRYAIVELRPGTYRVTFTLSGFRQIRREGIIVTAGASIPVNAQLSVGALEETVTVSGESPVVDIQQATQRQVLDREVLDALPTNRTVHSAGMVVPGLRMTGAMVGGQGSTVVQQYLVARGKNYAQNSSMVDGVDTRMAFEGTLAYTNFAMAQEVAVEINPTSAEVSGGGIAINTIPREGGNRWAGDVYFSGSYEGWQGNNITDALRAAGLATPEGTKYIFDLSPAFGGPIRRDKLWFFTSGRLNHAKLAPAGATYYERNPVTGTLAPGTRQGFNQTFTDNYSYRLTWQVAPKHKVATYYDQFWRSQDHWNGTRLTDWTTVPTRYDPGWQFIWPTKWSYTATNRLLIEAGFSRYQQDNYFYTLQEGVLKTPFTPEWYANASRLDVDTGYQTASGGNQSSCCWHSIQPANSYMGSVSYVTGSHALKVGVQDHTGYRWNFSDASNGALQQQYVNGLPNFVSVAAVPALTKNEINHDVGFYAQDRWTIDRLTVNAGVRVEFFRGGVAATTSPAGRFVRERTVDPLTVWDFRDVLPRFGVVYDLFGDAKTAVKFSAGRYVRTLGVLELGNSYNPINPSSETRNWFDCDLIPGTSRCSGLALPTNGDDIAQDNEIPASTNPLFGLRAVLQPNLDLDRESSWDYSVSVQHEVMNGVSVTAAWYHSREGNLWGQRDRSITLNDFTPFQIPNPLGNSETITIYNLNPGVATGDRVTVASGINKRTYNGFEVSTQARLASGGRILGGWYADRKVSVTCDTNNPNDWRFCDQSGKLYQELGRVPTLPFQHEYKLGIVHPLPWHFEGALSFISYPGNGAGATGGSDANIRWLNVAYALPAGLFAPVGGRTVPVTVQLVPPGARHLDRWNQLDISFKRRFRMGGIELLPAADIYNVTNSVPVLAVVGSYPAHARPVSTLPARLLRLGFLVKF